MMVRVDGPIVFGKGFSGQCPRIGLVQNNEFRASADPLAAKSAAAAAM